MSQNSVPHGKVERNAEVGILDHFEPREVLKIIKLKIKLPSTHALS